MNKIFLYNYSLSVYFSRGKKELFQSGTWFLFATQLFCISVSLAMFFITRFDTKISGVIILILHLIIGYLSYYGTKKWLFSQLKKRGIEKQYKYIRKLTLYRIIGLLLYFGSFFLFLIVAILTFQGYLNA